MARRIFISTIHQRWSPSSLVCNRRLLFPDAFSRRRRLLSTATKDVHIHIKRNITSASLVPPFASTRCRHLSTDTHHTDDIIKRLQSLSSGPICDADKGRRSVALTSGSDDIDIKSYEGISLMFPNTMKLRNITNNNKDGGLKMIGIARTLQMNRPNDFLSVLQALDDINSGDILVVNTGGSTKAVAGSLFTTELARRGAKGLIVDGPIRDVNELACPVYSTLVSPYAGTVQHTGGESIDSAPIICGKVTVTPGDIIFGDSDGVLVGSAQSFASILHDAENIVTVEEQLIKGMKMGVSLHKMTNFEQHVRLRKEGKESKLEFRDDLHTIKFGAEPIHYD